MCNPPGVPDGYATQLRQRVMTGVSALGVIPHTLQYVPGAPVLVRVFKAIQVASSSGSGTRLWAQVQSLQSALVCTADLAGTGRQDCLMSLLSFALGTPGHMSLARPPQARLLHSDIARWGTSSMCIGGMLVDSCGASVIVR